MVEKTISNIIIISRRFFIDRNILFFIVFYILAYSFPIEAKNLLVYCENDICFVEVGEEKYRCSVGKNGITDTKIEGDNCTPSGTYQFRKVFYREDKNKLPIKTGLPTYKIHEYDAWCDDPNNPQYNQYVNLKYFDTKSSYEGLYRKDNLYDLIVVIGYNDNPIIKGKSSAIFMHIAREGYPGSAGCVCLSKKDLLKVLSMLETESTITIRKTNEK